MNDFGSAAGTSEIISPPHSKRENVFINRHLPGLIKKRGIFKDAIFHRCRCCVCDDDIRFRKLQTQPWSSWNGARRIHGSGGADGGGRKGGSRTTIGREPGVGAAR